MRVKPLLSTHDLSVRFGGVTAVENISMTVPSGEIRGIIGPNGAGKSTLFNALSGVVKTEGRIEFDGENIADLPVHRRAGLGLRRTFQHVRLMQNRTALENVLVGMHLNIPANPLKSVLNVGGGAPPDREARDRAREVMEFLGIESLILRETGTLTIAQQRLLELARALAPEPKLLMLDEPCAGLSVPAVQALNRILIKLKEEKKLTILLVEHVISLVIDVSDRVTVLDKGRVIAEGTGKEVMGNPVVKHAYLGTEASNDA